MIRSSYALETTRSDVPDWDSFMYVNFIVAVEMELGIKFGVADVESFKSVGDIVAEAHAPYWGRPSLIHRHAPMLFNSYEFIFAFLPVTLAGFFLLGQRSRMGAALAHHRVALLLCVVEADQRADHRPVNPRQLRPWRAVCCGSEPGRGASRAPHKPFSFSGIAFNVAFLGYFKYANFLDTTLNDMIGTNFVFDADHSPARHLIHHVSEDRVPHRRARATHRVLHPARLLSVRALLPTAHRRAHCSLPGDDAAIPAGVRAVSNREHISVGLTLFVFGLFKKVVLADSISPSCHADL